MAKRKATRRIVIHCSATRPDQNIGADRIREWHVARGWNDIGYHFVIRRDGLIELGRDLQTIGVHVAGHNADSVGICMVGGLDANGVGAADMPSMFTAQQWESLRALVRTLRLVYPHAALVGHRDLSPDADGDGRVERHEWLKTCPGFHVSKELSDL